MEIIDKARELAIGKEYDGKGASKKCYFVTIDGKEYALLIYKCADIEKNNIRLNATKHLYSQGLSTPNIIGIDYEDGIAYELQEKAHGKVFAYRAFKDIGGEDRYLDDTLQTLNILDNASLDVFLKLLNDFRILRTNGYEPDCHSDNFFIDENGNITFVDLDIHHEPSTTENIFQHNVIFLPSILSFPFGLFSHGRRMLQSDCIYYQKCHELLKNICYKWLEACVQYLTLFNFSIEEIRRIVSGIYFNYFTLDDAEKEKMLNDFFSDSKIIGRKNEE